MYLAVVYDWGKCFISITLLLSPFHIIVNMLYVVSWVYDTVCCTLYSCMMYDQRSVAYTNKNILFVSHVVYQSRTIRIIHEYTERYGGYNISPFVEKAL